MTLNAIKTEDVRWKQRFSNFRKALQALNDAVKLAKKRKLSALEEQGLIQSFEFTHELGWKVLKDYLEYQGVTGITGSRDAARAAFKSNLVKDGEIWMNMITDRNRSSHTYSGETAQEIAGRILEHYFLAFNELEATFRGLEKHGDE